MAAAEPGDCVLLCLPHAGAGAAFFRPWLRHAPDGLRLVPLQLPGREERIDEDPCTDVASAVADLAAQVTRLPARLAVFGHSYGAVLGYELARVLAAKGARVERIFASGSPAPFAGRSEQAGALTDAEFLDRVQDFAGYRHSAFDIPELRELLLPTLRADVCAHEGYRSDWVEPTTIAVTCLRGRDDHLVPADYAEGWQQVSTVAVERLEFSGGHMYLTEHAEALVATMAERLLG